MPSTRPSQPPLLAWRVHFNTVLGVLLPPSSIRAPLFNLLHMGICIKFSVRWYSLRKSSVLGETHRTYMGPSLLGGCPHLTN